MSRVIKFRAWDYDTASGKYKMFCFEDIKNNCGAYFFDTHSYDFKHIIMGFTGLHDKNGKEIYEGDIVKITYSPLGFNPNIIEYFDIGVVIFPFYVVMKFKCSKILDEEKKEIYHRDTKEVYTLNGKEGYINKDLLFDKRIEVIGNIHENPELLEKKQ